MDSALFFAIAILAVAFALFACLAALGEVDLYLSGQERYPDEAYAIGCVAFLSAVASVWALVWGFAVDGCRPVQCKQITGDAFAQLGLGIVLLACVLLIAAILRAAYQRRHQQS